MVLKIYQYKLYLL